MSKDGLVPYERTSAVQQQASSRALMEVNDQQENSISLSTTAAEIKTTEDEKPLKSSVEHGKENTNPDDLMKGIVFRNMQSCTINVNI